ncbi:protein trichome birefringence-like 35 [Dorcoceras hygrometricum]|uniref:Protein trichome birefringence-like 35 n=1 Tax=Dorcoceras hygrometricum TaxID=472368 RepID=A0A2Z7B0H3_9LAMI|nr:protein trichome birefringence-like 35 [Dorcoceras hygrometricum]
MRRNSSDLRPAVDARRARPSASKRNDCAAVRASSRHSRRTAARCTAREATFQQRGRRRSMRNNLRDASPSFVQPERSIASIGRTNCKIAVDYRQSGPRPDPRLLRQAALEALTRSARTDTPRKTRPEQFRAKWAEAASGGGRRTAAARKRRGGGVCLDHLTRRCPTLAQSSSASSGRRRPAPEQRNSIGRPLSREAAPSVARDARPAAQRFTPRASSDAASSMGISSTCVTLNGSGIQLAVGPQPLWLRNHNSIPAQRIMFLQEPVGHGWYGPFNPYIPIGSTTIGKSRVAIDPIAMHTSWRSNSDIASVTSTLARDLHTIIPSDSIGYPRMSASGESSTTMHRLLHASGSHPIPTPGDPR